MGSPTIHYPIPHLPYLGKGSLLLDVFDANGLATGYRHFGNVTTAEQEIKDDKAELFQHINRTPTLIATAVKKRVLSLKLTGTDFSSDHMEIAMLGTKSTLTVAADAITGETLASATAVKKGRYFATLIRNIDPATVVVNQSGQLTEGTDYVIMDPIEGIIYFPLDSGVDDATAVTIDYTPIATSYDQVAGATKPFVKGKLRFVPDPTDGQKIAVEWWRCNLTPNGKFELIKDDYGNWELEVMVLDDSENHPDSPYFTQTFTGVVTT
jgi:hypothetical protein